MGALEKAAAADSRRVAHQGLSANSKITRVAPNQIDLTCTGSGRLIGGPDTQRLIVASAVTLNTNGTAGDILQLLHQSKVTRDARFQANEVRSVTRESKLERYKKAKKLTAGVVFHSGNGELDANVYNEVIRRMEYCSDNAAKIEEKKKKKMIELKRAVDAIRAKKLTLKDLVVSQLKTMCKWKKQPGDATLPTTKKALKQLYKKTMHNPSPHVSPYNSDAEEEAGDASDIDSMDSDASVPENDDLEFGKEYEIDEEE